MGDTYTPVHAKGLILARQLPAGAHVTGSLDLRGCDLSGVTLPQSVGGWLDLSGCDLSGLTLPQYVGGSLYLSGCDLSGVTLPQSVDGSLDLSGCDLSGVTLPQSVGGWLDLRGCNLSGVTTWWTGRGETTPRRCIAVDYYALIETAEGQYIAGCRGPWTADRALAHWGAPNRTDSRARKFVEAIRAAEEARAAQQEA